MANSDQSRWPALALAKSRDAFRALHIRMR
jgi:hypothetical protein